MCWMVNFPLWTDKYKKCLMEFKSRREYIASTMVKVHSPLQNTILKVTVNLNLVFELWDVRLGFQFFTLLVLMYLFTSKFFYIYRVFFSKVPPPHHNFWTNDNFQTCFGTCHYRVKSSPFWRDPGFGPRPKMEWSGGKSKVSYLNTSLVWFQRP